LNILTSEYHGLDFSNEYLGKDQNSRTFDNLFLHVTAITTLIFV
jgi:hypothetical protein